ncbi:MAG TPA: hypothetical protein VFE00_00575 [Arthrobacter sp.]|nr:hypothetical protein [Arthrobacter sp.]
MAWLLWGAGAADAAPADPAAGLGSAPLVLPSDELLEPGRAAPLRPSDTRGPAALLEAAAATVALPPQPLTAPEAATALMKVGSSAIPVLSSATPVFTEAAAVVGRVAGAVPVELHGPVVLPPTPLTETSGQTAGQDAGRAHAPAAAARPLENRAAGAQQAAGAVPPPAQLLARAPAAPVLPAALSAPMQPAAGHPAPSAPPDAPQNTENVLWLSALQSHPGPASSGSGSGGAQAAGEAAGFWNPWHAPMGARMSDVPQTAAASPSFDPGSSPD